MKQWIGRFEPHEGVVCPGFHRLRYLAECPHGCAMCYLQGTYWRGRPRDITEADLEEMERRVARWMRQRDREDPWGSPGRVLNAGELSDSFAPDICAQASQRLIELFRRQERHTLLLVTKAQDERLMEIEPTNQVIVSFSLTDDRSAVQNLQLTNVAWPLAAIGWRTRYRLDPLLRLTDATHLAGMVALAPHHPERITLGTLRFTAHTYQMMTKGTPAQRALAELVTKQQDGGSHPYRLPFEQRVEIYGKALEMLRPLGCEVGLCKEVPAVFVALGFEPRENRCNCQP